jgi:hypothetical protein
MTGSAKSMANDRVENTLMIPRDWRKEANV